MWWEAPVHVRGSRCGDAACFVHSHPPVDHLPTLVNPEAVNNGNMRVK
jgi:hypothetical protein